MSFSTEVLVCNTVEDNPRNLLVDLIIVSGLLSYPKSKNKKLMLQIVLLYIKRKSQKTILEHGNYNKIK